MKPSATAMLISHPVVTTTLLTVIVLTIVRALHDATYWPLVVMLLAATVPVSEARLKRNQYLAWKRDWDGLVEPTNRRHQ